MINVHVMNAHWCMCCLESSQCHFKKCKSESKTLDYPEKKEEIKSYMQKVTDFMTFMTNISTYTNTVLINSPSK